jgi:organic radical activating enzyme
MTNFYKNYNLKESKTFCIAPWVHLHTSPSGVAAPCCISESCNTDEGIGNSKTQSLIELVNADKMKKLRVDMLTGIPNKECTKCYNHEKSNVKSSRNMLNNELAEFYDESITNTQSDGTLKDFKMRYFDIRFSNICNFKCRTCGSGFSSQWEQEDIKSQVSYARIIPKNDSPEFLEDVKGQVQNLKSAYFAGGEPLITEEHYILLEEMIRKGATYVQLRYNTNMSNLKFKDKDLLGLWKQFKHPVDIYASIDHYGDRAEYIRHGTDWGLVETNLLKAKETPFIKLQMNTVLSAFNFCTIGEFYQYIIDKGLYKTSDWAYTLYNMSTPEHYACHMLPEKHKVIGRASLEGAIKMMQDMKFRKPHVAQLQDALPWALMYNTWDQHKVAFRQEINRVDKLRGEDFQKVFPELAELLDTERPPIA